ncbi:ABC transporter substrate-binding protein [Brytella acorum]|uniref:ABC transporter substrate-binding protein n=1 Tax=Brytella acorum TaxID=2959299 RepID=A0AA35XXL3_9PROT|nr:ABC transporter substrate-binding protein [Brytella acorum]MDF3625172.1 ABC transporter substrate-binding protein [Brytella acorum]CAI9122070.1 ABC transporter substrate-binding protein [Brytella acorum]
MRYKAPLSGFLLTGLLSALTPPMARATPPQRIVEGWYAHNATLILLGATDRIVATVDSPKRVPWMFRLVPRLNDATLLDVPMMNAEEMLRLKADLVFVMQSTHSATALRAAGVKAVEEGFSTFQGLMDCVTSTAALLEDPLAQARAQDYVGALKIELAKSPSLEGRAPPRVLHIQSLTPLKVDGDGTIIDEWIRAAGGRMAAQNVHGNMQPVTIEQVIAWNPDIIIVGAHAGDIAPLKNDPLWRQVAAVQAGHVYRNPEGVFAWDRYGPELLLQLQWARGIISGKGVDRPAMMARIRAFYARFYDIRLSEEDAGRILDAQPPG